MGPVCEQNGSRALGMCLLWVLGAAQPLLLQERRLLGTLFRAGLERSWILSWISWLRNPPDQHLAMGALPLVSLIPEKPVPFPLAVEVPCGSAVSEREEMQLPSDREREHPEGRS